MEHRKPHSAKDPSDHNSSTSNTAPPWKGRVLTGIAVLVLVSGIWSTGVIQDRMAGPKTPLPRQNAEFTLGMMKADILAKYPKLKKKLRKFNDDPVFRIVTLEEKDGLTSAQSVDLIFYKDKLYFISAKWQPENVAQAKTLNDMTHEYRRWSNNRRGDVENLGGQTSLREWRFKDAQTEMIMRDLDDSKTNQWWQDLRDASNTEAQDAFAKYRLDGAN